jgi:hypothetical protein
MFNFGYLKTTSAADVSTVSPDSQAFSDITNDATRQLMRRGDWPGTVVPIHVCVQRGCVVWPRYVGEIRKMNMCRHGVEIHNMWFNFLPYNHRSRWEQNWWHDWIGGRTRAVASARSPVFQDIMGDGRTIRAYPSTPLDNNKTVRIFGVDNNGQQLMTTGAGGWTNGITLTLKTPFVESTQTVRRIDRVIKDATQGPVRLYANNSGTLEELATYAPDETNPSYLRQQLHMPCCGDCATTHSVVALVKLQFVPVVNDDDPVLIENEDALKYMFQAIKAGESNDREGKIGFEQDAVRELNLQLADRDFDEQIPVSMGELGNTRVGRQRTF